MNPDYQAELDRLRSEEAQLAETYAEQEAQHQEARQSLANMEHQLSRLTGDQQSDQRALMALNETNTLEDVVVITTRLDARPVLIDRTRDAIEIARARVKERERYAVDRLRPLNEVRAKIRALIERDRAEQEEKIMVEHKRNMEMAINTFRSNYTPI